MIGAEFPWHGRSTYIPLPREQKLECYSLAGNPEEAVTLILVELDPAFYGFAVRVLVCLRVTVQDQSRH